MLQLRSITILATADIYLGSLLMFHTVYGDLSISHEESQVDHLIKPNELKVQSAITRNCLDLGSFIIYRSRFMAQVKSVFHSC